MKTYITDKEVRDFLQDFAENSQTLILEEGKERDEILEIAQARGIKLKGSKDLAGFKTIYTFADEANKNRARLPKEKLLKALPGIVGKPVDIDHNRRYVIGHYIDYRYIVKDEMVVAYGVFYKSNFADEYEKATQLFKAGKLTTSYEIWCPKNKRRKLDDGTYELLEEEIAGGALLFKTTPAFEDAKVLEFAKSNIDKMEDEMVYASEYKCEDLIMSGEVHCSNCGKCQHETVATVPPTEAPKVEEKKPEIVKIKCANCQHEFEKPQFAVAEIKCSECFAIINDKGEILYPPQIIDFNISCPSCSSRNWRLLERAEEKGKLKCLSCAKSFNIEFEQVKKDENLDKLQFLHIGRVSCKQCGWGISYSGTSHNKTYNLKCSHCGLQFAHDITHEQIKKLTKIEKVIAQSSEPIKASEEATITTSDNTTNEVITSQADELKTDNSAINTEEAKGETEMSVEKKEEVVEQKPVEAKVEEQKPVETPKVEDTPKVEATPEAKPEVAEVKPVVPAEEAKVETPVESKKEETEEDEYEESFEVAKKLTYEQKQNLSDKDFAVVVEKDGKKIRKYPIHDEAHVRNALARLGNAKNRAELEKLGVDADAVIRKIKAKAKRMGIETAKRYVASVKKLAKKIKEMKKEKTSVVKAMEEKIEFYKANAEEITKRRKELGDFGKELSDTDLLDEKKYGDAKLEKANKELETSSVAGTKKQDDDYIAKTREIIRKKSEGLMKRDK